MIQCSECGREVTWFSWVHGQRLCEHLQMDYLSHEQDERAFHAYVDSCAKDVAVA